MTRSTLRRRAALRALVPALAFLAFSPLLLTAQSTVPVPAPAGDSAGAARSSGDFLSQPAINIDRVVAIVGDYPILWSDVLELVNQRRAQGLALPTDLAGQQELLKKTVDELVDEEVLVQRAKIEKIEVPDAEVASSVDAQIKRIRDQIADEAIFRTRLVESGYGSPEEYRKQLVEQAKRSAMQQRVLDKLKADGRMPAVAVTEEEVSEAFERNRASLPKRPARVTFRQIMVAPSPSPASKAAAKAKAEAILAELRAGADFEQVAKRESMDPGSREVGGDLGWNRRGAMVPEFDRMMFALPPAQLSPVVETSFGYHIIRVDRVQPAEVKARHILIRPTTDSTDVTRARARADSVAVLWRGGTPFDSLVTRFHDAREEKAILQPFDRAQLPPTYTTAFEGKAANDVIDPFAVEDKQSGVPKFVVAQLLTATEGGDYTVADLRTTIKEQLSQERAYRRLLDSLRKDVYVSLRLDTAAR